MPVATPVIPQRHPPRCGLQPAAAGVHLQRAHSRAKGSGPRGGTGSRDLLQSWGQWGGGQQRRSGGSGVPPSPLGAQGAVAGATQPLCCACVAALWTPGFTEGAAPTGRAAGALTPPHPPWASPPHGSSAQRSSQAWPLPEPSSCPRGHWEGPRKLMGPQKEGPTLHLQGRRRPSWEV